MKMILENVFIIFMLGGAVISLIASLGYFQIKDYKYGFFMLFTAGILISNLLILLKIW